MLRTRPRWLSAWAVLMRAACTHTGPPTITVERQDGPFAATPPVRLPWSALAELEPGFSPDGNWISYVFERDADRDRCIGVIPATGGTRSRTLCAWELDEAAARDGLAAPGLANDGRLFFTRQFGRMFTMPNDSSALYLAGAQVAESPHKIASMPINMPGSSRSWQDLMSPVWISDDEVLAL